MFNNDNPHTNGELNFIKGFADNLTIFDVGSRDDSWFTSYKGEVHYFEPVTSFIEELKKRPNDNSKSIFNNFGLSDKEETIKYYSQFQSFVNRNGTPTDELLVKTGKDYIEQNDIKKIDFLKIDVEGFEFNVLKGFEGHFDKIGLIQFEYGGTYRDSGVKLNDVFEFLKSQGFIYFFYMIPDGLVSIGTESPVEDHYAYCNIISSKFLIPLVSDNHG